ncbi:hypothetical protein ANN_16998 [Periplaneta americana]|uniref:Uncharacterized protein n=1 Tax=Periplaneta americana TaxID=6978 RepID=A0ABQ8SSW7_PERAM|nr:hypothetical protein ANN_16998 [Periplaneta americana]
MKCRDLVSNPRSSTAPDEKSLTLFGSEFKSRGTATVKEDEYEDVRWEGMDNIEECCDRVSRYPSRWIDRGGPIAGPPRSPDLNPLDFYLWDHLKELMTDVALLHNRIIAGYLDQRYRHLQTRRHAENFGSTTKNRHVLCISGGTRAQHHFVFDTTIERLANNKEIRLVTNYEIHTTFLPTAEPVNYPGVKPFILDIILFSIDSVARAVRRSWDIVFFKNVFMCFKQEKHLSGSAVVIGVVVAYGITQAGA